MRLREVVGELERAYPPELAEAWDAVGLVCGDPDAEVEAVLLAVDPVQEVVDEALTGGAQLLLTHHPLYLRGTSTVAATTPKGRVVHALVRGGCALHVAHTNADRAAPGVSDALAALLDLQDVQPLVPGPLPGTGLGRVGRLPGPLPLAELVERAAAVLPATAWGVRAAGDPDAVVHRLAVSGGAGDSLLQAASAAGADALLTSDLRHHPASERPEGLALLDAAHWATEAPWLDAAAALLTERTGLRTTVSRRVTDPFTLSSPAPSSRSARA